MSEQQKMDRERAAFEAWMREAYAADEDMLKKPHESRYFYAKPANMWSAWQARASLPVGVPDAEALLTRLAEWCDKQPKQPWYGRTAGDMVRTFMACQPLDAPAAQPASEQSPTDKQSLTVAEQSAPGEVEEVEVVGYRFFHVDHGDIFRRTHIYEGNPTLEAHSLMTVAQHNRIVAAISAQQSAQPEFCCKHSYKVAKQAAWDARDLTHCKCDHNEYCEHCWPDDFKEGGKWYNGFEAKQSAHVSVPRELLESAACLLELGDMGGPTYRELRALLASHGRGEA